MELIDIRFLYNIGDKVELEKCSGLFTSAGCIVSVPRPLCNRYTIVAMGYSKDKGQVYLLSTGLWVAEKDVSRLIKWWVL